MFKNFLVSERIFRSRTDLMESTHLVAVILLLARRPL